MGNSEKRPYYLPLAATLRAVFAAAKIPKMGRFVCTAVWFVVCGNGKRKEGFDKKNEKNEKKWRSV